MISLFNKELAGFFSSLTGYIVIVVFLVASGLFLWVIPGNNNLLDSGYASINSFFALAPWLFLFLIPAITMRLFTDEKKTGTIELLFTRPLSETQIVLAKFFAALTIVLVSLLPTLIYFYSAYKLGNPVGNIDTGGTWGSYIGLLLLAAAYTAVGIFTSALTDNQIVAFILALVGAFTLFYGFDLFSSLFSEQRMEFLLQTLSINRHYQSLSRGVIDSRDLVFFLSLIVLFVLLTKVKLQSRKW